MPKNKIKPTAPLTSPNSKENSSYEKILATKVAQQISCNTFSEFCPNKAYRLRVASSKGGSIKILVKVQKTEIMVELSSKQTPCASYNSRRCHAKQGDMKGNRAF